MLNQERETASRPDNLVDLGERAEQNLRFIRETMDNSSRFTDVPGKATVLIGFTALATSFLAASQATEAAWLRVWGLKRFWPP